MAKVNYFLLAENCILDSEGRFSIINVFNNVNSTTDIATPKFCFAIGVVPKENEIKNGKLKIEVRILKPDGSKYFAAKAEGAVPKSKIGHTVVSPLDLTGSIKFDTAGEHKGELFVNGKKQSELSFNVKLNQKPPKS